MTTMGSRRSSIVEARSGGVAAANQALQMADPGRGEAL